MQEGHLTSVNLETVKRLAKKIKRDQLIPLHQSLDLASQELGFKNYGHARQQLVLKIKPTNRHLLHTLTYAVPWADERTHTQGIETLDISVSLNDDFSIRSRKSGGVRFLQPGATSIKNSDKVRPSQYEAYRRLRSLAVKLAREYPEHVLHAPAFSTPDSGRRPAVRTSKPLP